jgi:hypothetical protein
VSISVGYPVETGLDPGAVIIDPSAASLAYDDLMDAWLSARFGRDRGAVGLGRIPPIPGTGGEGDFFAELVNHAPDATLKLIQQTAHFLKSHRTASAEVVPFDNTAIAFFSHTVKVFVDWYAQCGVREPTTNSATSPLPCSFTSGRRAT